MPRLERGLGEENVNRVQNTEYPVWSRGFMRRGC